MRKVSDFMELSNLTNKNLFVIDCDVTTKEECLRTLTKKLYQEGKITSQQAFLDAVYAREALSATGIEGGLAIPLGKSSCVKEACFAAMTTKKVIYNWDSLDQSNRVKCIFLFAIPENDIDCIHLDILAELMMRISDPSHKKRLLSSKTAEDFYINIGDDSQQSNYFLNFSKTMVAVTACPAGVAHTYMAADALVKAGDELGVKIYVENQSANGIENKLPTEIIRKADVVVFAADVTVRDIERFKHLPQIKVSVVEPIRDGVGVICKALDEAVSCNENKFSLNNSNDITFNKDVLKNSVMTGISYMIPLIIVGGMFGAFASLINTLFDLQHLYNDSNSWIGIFRSVSNDLLGVILIPVLSAYMAYAIGDKTAFAAGYSAGVVSNLINGGFLAGMIGGVLAGYVVLFLKKQFPSKGTMAGFTSFWFYPVFSSFIVVVLMFNFIGKPVSIINGALVLFLTNLSGFNVVVLGIVIGFMVSFDLGGPVNKCAYTFCTGMILEGFLAPYAIFASAKMVSGFAVTFATIIDKKSYSEEEIEIGKSTWILALTGLTEGAIPFMMIDPFNVITSLCIGSAITGGIVAYFNIGLAVPGAGIFSVFMLQSDRLSSLMAISIWFFSAVVGAIVSTSLLILLKGKYKV